MNRNDSVMTRAARTIRPLLPGLIGSDAPDVDRLLTELLARTDAGEDLEKEIGDVLREHQPMRLWLIKFASEEHAPHEERRYVETPSPVSPIAALTVRCPKCGRAWLRSDVREELPEICTEDGTPLKASWAR